MAKFYQTLLIFIVFCLLWVSHALEYLLAFFHVNIYFHMQGTFAEVTGPTLPELLVQTQAGYPAFSTSISLRAVGQAVGGIFGNQ